MDVKFNIAQRLNLRHERGMIYDTLDNADRYAALHPRFGKAFAFLRSVDASLSTGKYVIDGEEVFAGADRYVTKTLEETLFEAHRRYADVQVLFAGRETLLWAPLEAMSEVENVRLFDAVKDVAKWKAPAEYAEVPLQPGRFAILFPEDAHAPGVTPNGSDAGEVLKVVVKVALD